MTNKLNLPKLSEKKAAALSQACQLAHGGHPADAFVDEALAEAERLQKLRAGKKDQKSLAE